MELSAALRERLWPARDWWARFAELEAVALTHPDPAVRGHWGFELAVVAEYLVPSARRAIRLYHTAWKATHQHIRALQRIRGLCVETGQLTAAAQTAELELQVTERPQCAALAGALWLDAGEPKRAVPLLRRAASAMPDSAAVRGALAVVDRGWHEPADSDESLRTRAIDAQPRAAATLLLQVARIWRLAGDDQAADDALYDAVAQDPTNTYAAALLERRLRATERWHELAHVYQTRAHAAASDAARVDIYRHAGITLVRDEQDAIGRAFLIKGLTIAYEHGLAHPPGHLAMLRLLADGARGDDAVRGLADLCAWAASTPLAVDDRVGVSVLAAPFTRADIADPTCAARHWLTLRELMPRHEVVVELGRALGVEDGATDSAAAAWAVDAAHMLHDGVAASGARARALAWSRTLFEAMSVELDRLAAEQRERDVRDAEARVVAEERRRRERSERAAAQSLAVEALAGVLDDIAGAMVGDADDVIELDDDAVEFLDVPDVPERRVRPDALSPAQREGDRVLVGVGSVALEAPVRVTSPDGSQFAAQLRDVSVSGAFVQTDRPLEVGARVSLRIEVPGPEELGASTYEIPSRVVRVDPGTGFGAEFLESPPDFRAAVGALRTLVR